MARTLAPGPLTATDRPTIIAAPAVAGAKPGRGPRSAAKQGLVTQLAHRRRSPPVCAAKARSYAGRAPPPGATSRGTAPRVLARYPSSTAPCTDSACARYPADWACSSSYSALPRIATRSRGRAVAAAYSTAD